LIIWEILISIQRFSFILIKSSREFIAANDSENSFVHIEIRSNLQVLPIVIFGFIMGIRKLVPLQKDSLWNTSIFHSRLNDVDCIIVQVVINNAFSDSEILIRILNDWLLEVGVEF